MGGLHPKRTNVQHPGGGGKRIRDIWGISQGLPVDHFLPTGFIYPGYVRHQAVLHWYGPVSALPQPYSCTALSLCPSCTLLNTALLSCVCLGLSLGPLPFSPLPLSLLWHSWLAMCDNGVEDMPQFVSQACSQEN